MENPFRSWEAGKSFPLEIRIFFFFCRLHSWISRVPHKCVPGMFVAASAEMTGKGKKKAEYLASNMFLHTVTKWTTV